MIFAHKTRLINISLLILAGLLIAVQKAYAANNQVVIFQVQTGAAASASQEYISIYNNGTEPADVSDWCVVYASASDATQTQLKCITPPNASTKLMLPGHTYLTMATNEFLNAHQDYSADFVFSAGMSGTSGHIKLLDSSKAIIDKIGWGAAANSEGSSMPAHPIGKILQRLVESVDMLKDTGNNSNDFQVVDLGLIQPGNLYEENSPAEPNGAFPVITEIMPDAEGADVGKEFIELHNPRVTPIKLNGYTLQIGPAYSKSYVLPDIIIEPSSYISFSDQQLGLVLPNTLASIRLLAPNGEVLSSSEAYDHPGEGISWALINDIWQATHSPTPSSENILLVAKPCPTGQVRSEITGYCKNSTGADTISEITTCRADQERNPQTNRCRKITALVASLLPCKKGQARSLDTGRCRSIISALTGSQSCKPGQTRNPETKRCRNASSVVAKKPCPAGQERNVQTGRCRKTLAGTAKLNGVKDVQTGLIANNAKWWAAGAAAAGSAGYAVYEWRREAWLLLEVIKSRIIPN